MTPSATLAFVLLGAVLGTVGTVIGAGGGFLLVPALLLLGWPHQQAVGTSLLMVAANAGSGSLSYLRQRLVDKASGWRFALCTLPGAVLGSLVEDHISGRAFDLVFAVLSLGLSAYLLYRPLGPAGDGQDASRERPAGWRGRGWVERRLTDARGTSWRYAFAQPFALLFSGLVGFLSSALGIGGGIVHVPALIKLFRFPAHVATATSHFILFFTAAAGCASHCWLGHVRLPPGLCLAAGAVAGAQLGGALARRVRAAWIMRALALGLGLVGLRLLWLSR